VAEADIDASVGSVGDSCHNAPVETINALYKTEANRRRGPRITVDEAKYATLE